MARRKSKMGRKASSKKGTKGLRRGRSHPGKKGIHTIHRAGKRKSSRKASRRSRRG